MMQEGDLVHIPQGVEMWHETTNRYEDAYNAQADHWRVFEWRTVCLSCLCRRQLAR